MVHHPPTTRQRLIVGADFRTRQRYYGCLTVVFTLFPSSPRRDAVLAALALDDDGAKTFEIGRPATGATCVLIDDTNGWQLLVPLLRTPTSAQDLIPAVAVLVPLGLTSPLPIAELIAVWEARHRAACQERMATCASLGAPPPHLPRAELLNLHGWLLALSGRDDVAGPILAVDFQNGDPVTLAVVLPAAGSIPPVPAVLSIHDGEARLFVLQPGDPRDAALLRAHLQEREGLPLGRARIVTPVEIVDSESLAR